MSLWISSGAFKSKQVSEVLNEAKHSGIKGIELSSGMSFDEHWLESVTKAIELDRQRFLIHNYFPAPKESFVLNIGSLDPDGLALSKDFACKALELTKTVGASFYSIHAGFAAALKPEHLGAPVKMASYLSADKIDRDASYNVMLDTVRELADRAKGMGLGLLIENNVISPKFLKLLPINPLLLTTADEVETFFNDIDRDNVGLLLDVAHVKVSANALAFCPHNFIEKVNSYTRCVHLSDNDGVVDDNRPVSKDSWFMPHLPDFKDCEFVLEAYNLDPDILFSQCDLLNDIIS